MKRLVLILSTLILMFPIYWMVVGSFMKLRDVIALPPTLLPRNPTLDNYDYYVHPSGGADNSGVANLPEWVRNTVLLAVVCIVINVLITGTGAYSLAFIKPWGHRVIFWAFMAGVMVPGNVMFIARFVWFARLGIMRLPIALVLLYIFSPATLFLARNYMLSIPGCLRDMARLDGCGELRTFAHIVLPLCKPIVGVIAIGTGVAVLQDYLWQLITTEGGPYETLMVGIMRYVKYIRSVDGTQLNGMGIMLAGGVILMVPVLVVFWFGQRNFRGGMIKGAVR